MLAKIQLNNMDFFSYHGFYPHEREKGNYFRVDISFECFVAVAANQDDINGTVDYEKVYQLVKEEMAIPSKLMEHVSKRIIDKIKNSFPKITKVTITIAKKEPPIQGDIESVSVTMEG